MDKKRLINAKRDYKYLLLGTLIFEAIGLIFQFIFHKFYPSADLFSFSQGLGFFGAIALVSFILAVVGIILFCIGMAYWAFKLNYPTWGFFIIAVFFILHWSPILIALLFYLVKFRKA